MKAFHWKTLTIGAALGISGLLLSTPIQAQTPDANQTKGKSIVGTVIPAASRMQIDPMVQAGTAHLNLDQATRARYRYHNGSWLFQTQQGDWLVSENGSWQQLDPAKHPGLVQYISSQAARQQGSDQAQANSGTDHCYCVPTTQNYYSNQSFTHHRHHEFGGIHYGHQGTGFRDGFK